MKPPFEILSREAIAHPHAVYSKLRNEAPICQVEHGWWAVSRHRDVVFVLKHPELFSSTDVRAAREAAIDERLRRDMVFPEHASLIGNDPPVHTRLRKLVTGAFAPKAMARLEPRIRAITTELLDRILNQDTFDVVTDLAMPLPVTVIAEMLGIDPSRRRDFKRWSDDIANVDVVEQRSDAEIARILDSRHELRAFIEELLLARRADPRDDLMSDLARAEVTPDEALSLAVTLLVAGNVTTTNLIGTGMLTLAEHPHVFSALRRDPSLVPSFVEEVLRFDGPVKMLLRRATEDVELSGTAIPEGSLVVALLASANRDPDVFANPDDFDLRRDARGHVGFGFGIHFCVGAALSRVEGRLAFEEVAGRLPRFSRQPGPLAWAPAFGLRGLVNLPLRFDTRVAA
jgi:cytochrome P450